MAQTKAQLLGPVVGDVVMDVSTLSLDAEGNKVGIGHTEPDLTLHVNGVDGLPSSSGSTPTGHLTIRNKATSTKGMFLGVSDASPFGSWIQAQDANNNATNYPLLLNPNGGSVGIGTNNPQGKLVVSDGANGLEFNPNSNNAVVSYNRSTSAYAPIGLQGSTVQLRIGGVGTALHVHSDGNVGINQSNPQAKLQVDQDASDQSGAAALKVVGTAYGTNKSIHSYMGTTSNTKSLFYAENSNGVVMNVAGNGNVGIGTASPTSKLSLAVGSGGEYVLDVKGTAARQWGLYYDQNSWLESTFRIDEFSNTGAATTRFSIADGGKVGINETSPSASLDVKGTVTAGDGNDEDLQQWNIGSNNVKSEIKYVDADANRGMLFGTTTDHVLAFQTNNTEKLRISSDGKVGIGQVSPQGDLHIGNISGNKDLIMHSANNSNARVRFREGGSNASGFNEYSIGMVGNRNAITIDGQGAGEILTIKGDTGFVGIGQGSPNTSLEIQHPSYISRDVMYPLIRLVCQSNTEYSGNQLSAGVGIEFTSRWTGGVQFGIGRIGARGSQSYDGGLQFDVARNSAAGQFNYYPAMIINKEGYVGINDTNPSTVLAIKYTDNGAYSASGYAPAGGRIKIFNESTTVGCTAGEILFGSGASGTGYSAISAIRPGSQECELAFRVSDAATLVEALRINKLGNIGIGTDNPGAPLDVKRAKAGLLARFYDTGTNGNQLYNSGPIVGLSRTSNGNVSLDGLLFQVGIDNNLSPSYNIDETVFCVANTGVGIGEDDPQVNLHLSKSLGTTSSYKDAQMIRIAGTSNANQMAGIGFSYYTSNPANSAYPSAWIGAKVSSWTQYVKHDLVFATRGTDANTEPEERFRITEGGELHQNYDSRYKQQGHFTTNTSSQTNTNSPSLAGALSYSFGYQEGFSSSNGGWSFPYPKLVLGYHTGVNLGGHRNYYGCRFFEDHPSNSSSIVLSVGNQSTGVHVTNTLSKGGGTFRIAHPHPSKKYTHDLQHSFIEGPQCDNLYRGRVDLVNGTASINIDTVSNMTDGTFVLLNRDIQCFTSNETGWTAVKGSVSGNILTITAKSSSCTDTISWMVIGERQDDKIKSPELEMTDSDGKLIVEPLTIEETHM